HYQQKIMLNLLLESVPVLILISHVVIGFLILALVFRQSWGRVVSGWVGERAVFLAWIGAIIAMLGSLFYSVVLGYEPCVLCWWQRVLLFPLVIILGLAWWRGDRSIFRYSTPLVILAGVISLYQSYANLGGTSLLSCTSAEG